MHMGIKVAVCQAVSIARKFAWPVVVHAADVNCPMALLAFGWAELEPGAAAEVELTNYLLSAGYVRDEETAAKLTRQIPYAVGRSEPASRALLIWPLYLEVPFAPDVVVIYGNAAQVARMIQAYVYSLGSVVKSESQVGLSCASAILQPFVDGVAGYVVPGRGERAIAMAADDELAFTLPGSELGKVYGGGEETHEKGNRYPIGQHLLFEPASIRAVDRLRQKIVLRHV